VETKYQAINIGIESFRKGNDTGKNPIGLAAFN
jgi:hypothetical protein